MESRAAESDGKLNDFDSCEQLQYSSKYLCVLLLEYLQAVNYANKQKLNLNKNSIILKHSMQKIKYVSCVNEKC